MAKARIKKFIDLEEIERSYRIEEDGAVWSLIKNRYIAAITNTAGYYHVFISKPRLGWIGVARLVACKYLGQCPDGLETSHKDGNKHNNHYTNLEYITHSNNLKKSFREHGRPAPEGFTGQHTWATKQAMAAKKEKPIISSDDRRWGSIQKCADSLGVDRKVVYNAIRYGRRIRGVEVFLFPRSNEK